MPSGGDDDTGKTNVTDSVESEFPTALVMLVLVVAVVVVIVIVLFSFQRKKKEKETREKKAAEAAEAAAAAAAMQGYGVPGQMQFPQLQGMYPDQTSLPAQQFPPQYDQAQPYYPGQMPPQQQMQPGTQAFDQVQGQIIDTTAEYPQLPESTDMAEQAAQDIQIQDLGQISDNAPEPTGPVFGQPFSEDIEVENVDETGLGDMQEQPTESKNKPVAGDDESE